MRFLFHKLFWSAALLLCSLFAVGQTDSIKVVPQHEAVRITNAPKIDGVMDEQFWASCPSATEFVTVSPTPGEEPNQRTEVKVAYDDESVYFGIYLFDNSPDSILQQLSERDGEGNTDFFSLYIDTYNDNLNAFEFTVTAAGVQADARISPGDWDLSWNAVWISAVVINEDGWFIEIKLPYSALRFPKAEVQSWGISYYRNLRRIREESTWPFIDPTVDGEVNQYGDLEGIKNIEPPLRLAFFPYVSAYLEHYPYEDPELSDVSTSLNGGMDVKYGITDAFTLDMTLIPDFGQVQSDNLVLNLSPFEVRFNENRQFFTEGTEIFNKTGLFYSRRVGGTPLNFWSVYSQLEDGEEVVDNPSQSQLLNATKVSGRTSKGLGIGIFNGITKEMNATVVDSEGRRRQIQTDPLTNYNVVVFDQSLKNNSFVTLVNTNVMRAGATYDANVSGGRFRLANKKNTIAIGGSGVVTQKYGAEFETPELGHSYSMSADKIGGNLTYGVWHAVESDTYDPNDLGFLFNNNSSDYGTRVSYNIFKPFWKFNRMWSDLTTYYSRLYNPNKFADFNVSANVGLLWKSFLATGFGATIEPVRTYDFFEPRVAGRWYTWLPSNRVNAWYSSDYRKKVALDFNLGHRWWPENDRAFYNARVSPRFRVSDRLMIIPSVDYFLQKNDEGVAIHNQFGPTILGDTSIFSIRDQQTFESVLQASYIFTNTMGLTFRLRHYWSTLDYQDFNVLNAEGRFDELEEWGLDPASFEASNYNNNFNAFNIDMVFNWVFTPGSNLSVVWKSSLLESGNNVSLDYFQNLQNTLERPQLNSFSIKVLYYIDYLYLRRRKGRVE